MKRAYLQIPPLPTPSNSLRLLLPTTLFLSDLPVINFASNYHPYAFYALRPPPNLRYVATLLSLLNSTQTHYRAPVAASPSSTFSSETYPLNPQSVAHSA